MQGQIIDTFQRTEIKYRIPKEKIDLFLALMDPYIQLDEYGLTTICNIYYDTENSDLVIRSLEKPDYKEKLRLRSYGTAAADSTVFLELKKKFGGVVYKRRAAMTLVEAERYLRLGIRPFDSQIMREIDWAMTLYGRPKPAMMIACEREAWFDEEHPDLRLTFDRNIRYRESGLQLSRSSAGIALLPKETVLLEIKTAGAMPLWLADALDAEGILPGSFSKYGTAYTRTLEEKKQTVFEAEGGIQHVVNL